MTTGVGKWPGLEVLRRVVIENVALKSVNFMFLMSRAKIVWPLCPVISSMSTASFMLSFFNDSDFAGDQVRSSLKT